MQIWQTCGQMFRKTSWVGTGASPTPVIAGPKIKIKAQTTGSFKQLYCDHNQWGKAMEDVVLALENYVRGTEKNR